MGSDVLLEYLDIARSRREQTEEDLDKGRLAGSVGPNETYRTMRHLQRDIRERLDVSVVVGQIVDGEQWHEGVKLPGLLVRGADPVDSPLSGGDFGGENPQAGRDNENSWQYGYDERGDSSSDERGTADEPPPSFGLHGRLDAGRPG
jgi:hypothetical protein